MERSCLIIIFTPNTVIKSADVNLNLSGIADGSLAPALPKVINRQDNTTNNTVSNQLIQYGWGWVQGDGVNRILTETVTLPVAYDTAPVIIAQGNYALNGSDPATIGDLSVIGGNFMAKAGAITTSNFTLTIVRVSSDGNDPTVLSTVSRFGYVWIAIGTKAR